MKLLVDSSEIILSKSTTKLQLLCYLLLIKLFYIKTIDIMLPKYWLWWEYHKIVTIDYLPIELFVFVIMSSIYLWGYRRGSVYSVFSTMLFIIFYIPANSGLVLSNNDIDYYMLINTYAILLFCVLSTLSRRENIHIDQDRAKSKMYFKELDRLIRVMTYILFFFTLLYVYFFNGFDLSFRHSMYEVREIYLSYRKVYAGTWLSYILTVYYAITQWCLPIVLYFSIHRKIFVDIFVSLTMYLLLFSVSMEKATLMMPMVVSFVCFAERYTDFKKISELIIKIYILVFPCALIEKWLTTHTYMFDIFIDRIMYLPAYMMNVYYQFFKVNPKIYFTEDAFFIQRIMRCLTTSSYRVSVIDIIKANCFEGLLPFPNAGAFAEAYAQLGGFGVVLFPFIIAVYIKVIYNSLMIYGKGAAICNFLCFSMIFQSVYILGVNYVIGIIIMVSVKVILVYCAKHKVLSIKPIRSM